MQEAIAADKPTLIACKTVIGLARRPNKGRRRHTAPLWGEEEVAAARRALGWSSPPFEIPDDIMSEWQGDWQNAAMTNRPAGWNDWKNIPDGRLLNVVKAALCPTDGTARLMIGWLKLQKRARQWRHVKPAVWS